MVVNASESRFKSTGCSELPTSNDLSATRNVVAGRQTKAVDSKLYSNFFNNGGTVN